jgi:hypothetical protein
VLLENLEQFKFWCNRLRSCHPEAEQRGAEGSALFAEQKQMLRFAQHDTSSHAADIPNLKMILWVK